MFSLLYSRYLRECGEVKGVTGVPGQPMGMACGYGVRSTEYNIHRGWGAEGRWVDRGLGRRRGLGYGVGMGMGVGVDMGEQLGEQLGV